MSKVRVEATARGTFVSPNTGRIHHFDPDGSDPNARRPTVDMRDLDELKRRKLIGERAKGSAVATAEAPTLDEAVAKGLAAAAGIDEAAGVNVSPAAAIAQTNYPPSMNVGNDEPGLAPNDPDAPPVGARAAPPAAPAAPKPAPRRSSGRSAGSRSRSKAVSRAPAGGEGEG